MNISNICDYCEERDCKFCSFGNPCLGCNDYDIEKDICKSNGACREMIEVEDGRN